MLLSIFENIVKELYRYNLSEYKKSWSAYLWGQCFSDIQSKYRYEGDKHLIMFSYTKTK